MRDTGEYGNSFKELYGVFQNPTTTSINADKLRDLFKQPNDPCHRTDTTIKDGILTNDGDSCDMKAGVKQQAGKGVNVKVTIPAHLIATITKSEDAIRFSTVGWPILLTIGDPDLQEIWGGGIKELILTGTYARIPRNDGCIQYRF